MVAQRLSAPLSIPGYKTLLVSTDFSPRARAAASMAFEIGQSLGIERIHIVHVVSPHSEPLMRSFTNTTSRAQALEDEARAIKALKALELPLSEAAVTREVRVGVPAGELALAAGECGADLIVIASHGRGAIKRAFLGSVTEALLRVAPSPVLVIFDEAPQKRRFERVVATIDGSSSSEEILAHAIAMSKAFAGAVRIISLYQEGGVAHPSGSAGVERRRALHDLIERARGEGVELTPYAIADDDIARAILAFADREQADLIVAGTQRRTPVERVLLGSTTTELLASRRFPLLVVPESGI
jgi:nucleotide-binding universal stress UspA family protein